MLDRSLIPIAIQTNLCQPDAAVRRQGCLDTWIPTLSPHFLPVFLIGKTGTSLGVPGEHDIPQYAYVPQSKEAPGNYLVIGCHDDYPHLSSKIKAFCAWALETFDCPWVFKCDDDSYINGRLLTPDLFNAYDYAGCLYTETWSYGGNCPLIPPVTKIHGAGYALSRRVAQAMVDQLTCWEAGGEDVGVARVALHIPDVIVKDMWHPRIAPWSGNRMEADWLVGHFIRTPQDFKTIHERVAKGMTDCSPPVEVVKP